MDGHYSFNLPGQDDYPLHIYAIEALGLAIAFFTDPGGVRIELTEGLDAH